MVPALFRLRERFSSAVHVLEPINERSRQAQKWIRPVRSQCRRFAERDDSFGELLLGLRLLAARLRGLAVDAVQVSLAVA
jgi:hypothetical protein